MDGVCRGFGRAGQAAQLSSRERKSWIPRAGRVAVSESPPPTPTHHHRAPWKTGQGGGHESSRPARHWRSSGRADDSATRGRERNPSAAELGEQSSSREPWEGLGWGRAELGQGPARPARGRRRGRWRIDVQAAEMREREVAEEDKAEGEF
jgi:hypothetical protein|uniref:Uncharacterized protein n=1 Tax=Zea mays TaxID=4577 RepID=A0A804M9K4_MAIZE